MEQNLEGDNSIKKSIIEKFIKKSINETVDKLKQERLLKANINFYKKTELLLYNYKTLRLAIEQKEEDIKYMEQNGLPEQSKSIVLYSSARGNMTAGDRYVELIEKYKLEKAETERDIKRIDNALDKIRKDKYFKIIELKYLEQKATTDEEIAEIMGKDQSTISRNRSRLMNELKTILFPESIKELW